MKLFGLVLTLGAVAVSMVLFRSSTTAAAVDRVKGMIGLNGVALPASVYKTLGPLAAWLDSLGVIRDPGNDWDFIKMTIWIPVLTFIALFCPNTLQVLARYEPALGVKPSPSDAAVAGRKIEWSPALAWAFPADIARPCFDRSYARQGRLVSGENRCAALPRPLPFCDVNFAGEVDRRGVDCRHVHQPAARIVGWRPPVRGAAHCRRHERALAARFRLGTDDRVAVGCESRRPGLLGERPGEKKLSRLPVERIEKPVAICPQERGPLLSLPRDFREYRLLYCIPIVLIPGRELVVPSELPGAAIQGHHAVREEVGASAFLALEGRRRVADAPVQKVQIRVVCPGSPRRRSAGLPGIAGPGIVRSE